VSEENLETEKEVEDLKKFKKLIRKEIEEAMKWHHQHWH